ncbi:hypothetical protein EDB83DRAFT_439054 [Lactarius deliciosus]|nr:hypothetical protein EDB83DRAFT_439054 [Lactarius deliciosus]
MLLGRTAGLMSWLRLGLGYAPLFARRIDDDLNSGVVRVVLFLLVCHALSFSAWSGRRVWRLPFLRGDTACARACERARFVGNSMTSSTLALSLGASARVSFADRRVVIAAGADADATTLGFVELCVNAAGNAWSRGVGILDLSLSSSLSSSSSTTTVSYAAFFVFFPLGPVLPAPGQLFSNATCSTCTRSFEPALFPARAFLLAAVWRWRVRNRCLTGI